MTESVHDGYRISATALKPPSTCLPVVARHHEAERANKECCKRRPRFEKDELEILCHEVGRRKITLLGKFSDILSLEKKKKSWGEVTNKINAVSQVTRTVDEIRRKWKDWSSSVKGHNKVKGKNLSNRKTLTIHSRALEDKANLQTKTGGGVDTLPDLSLLEEKVLVILGKVVVSGLPEGMDTLGSPSSVSPSQNFSDIYNEEPKEYSNSDDSETVFAVSTLETYDTPGNSDSAKEDGKSTSFDILSIEKERLRIEGERLNIEKSRLDIEKSRAEKEEKVIELLTRLVGQRDGSLNNHFADQFTEAQTYTSL
ncbi:myb-related transcription factor, partner of profilin-like [Ruditapes philippinarum]|uniref:myb-related transcription factor, partner of profilin-like n=1 Tax=Ruditapes philippinarum TaxID=129788 RepID=UPI00295A801C|nr:myb-related transcription factor, partner of profilin-like [Ruditapes philippinarum]